MTQQALRAAIDGRPRSDLPATKIERMVNQVLMASDKRVAQTLSTWTAAQPLLAELEDKPEVLMHEGMAPDASRALHLLHAYGIRESLQQDRDHFLQTKQHRDQVKHANEHRRSAEPFVRTCALSEEVQRWFDGDDCASIKTTWQGQNCQQHTKDFSNLLMHLRYAPLGHRIEFREKVRAILTTMQEHPDFAKQVYRCAGTLNTLGQSTVKIFALQPERMSHAAWCSSVHNAHVYMFHQICRLHTGHAIEMGEYDNDPTCLAAQTVDHFREIELAKKMGHCPEINHAYRGRIRTVMLYNAALQTELNSNITLGLRLPTWFLDEHNLSKHPTRPGYGRSTQYKERLAQHQEAVEKTDDETVVNHALAWQPIRSAIIRRNAAAFDAIDATPSSLPGVDKQRKELAICEQISTLLQTQGLLHSSQQPA
jgi:hypothetical protein